MRNEVNETVSIDIWDGEKNISCDVERGITLGEAASRCLGDPEYKPLMAMKDGVFSDLLEKVDADCTVEFLDMRDRMARLAYQRTVYFLYLTVLYIEYPWLHSILLFPLNGGNYTRILKVPVQPKELIFELEKLMRDLIAEGNPIGKKICCRDEILSDNPPKEFTAEQIDYIRGCGIRTAYVYSLKDFSAVFYEPMLTDVTAIDKFELVPYDGGVIIRVPSFECNYELPPYRDDFKMYEVFKRTTKWRENLQVQDMADLNKKLESEEWRDLVLISDAYQEKRIAELADEIVEKNKRVILIAGPSSSGKTTFAQRLSIQLRANGKRPLYMGTDDYFKERRNNPRKENGKYDFESLSAIDVELFDRQLNELLDGKTVDMPVFDFISGSRRYGVRITQAESDQPIVIEGIHGLNRELTKQIDDELIFRIYISPLTTLNFDRNNRIPVTDVRLLRRIARDNRSRGKTARQTLSEWDDVRWGEIRNIFPYNGSADAVFNSAFIYEMAALKPLVEPSLREIRPDEECYPEAQRLLGLLAGVVEMTDTSVISNNSILREFVGGGIWVK